jgi:hypothetical protein
MAIVMANILHATFSKAEGISVIHSKHFAGFSKKICHGQLTNLGSTRKRDRSAQISFA